MTKPLATMEKAWDEYDRLGAEAESHGAKSYYHQVESNHHRAQKDRHWAEADLVVIATAEALYGRDAEIGWATRIVKPHEQGGTFAPVKDTGSEQVFRLGDGRVLIARATTVDCSPHCEGYAVLETTIIEKPCAKCGVTEAVGGLLCVDCSPATT